MQAANIAQCGASAGWAYFKKSDFARGSDADKWVKDGISNGRIALAKGADGSYDVLYGDTLSSLNSASKDGGLVVKSGQSSRALSIVVVYPGKSVETYTFWNRADGVKEVLWTTAKYGTLIPTVRAMRAACDFVLPQ
jgi:hypothetical protein